MLQTITKLVYGSSIIYRFNRRRDNDRRDWKPVRFPLIDSDGDVTLIDRRCQPDRRRHNIVFMD